MNRLDLRSGSTFFLLSLVLDTRVRHAVRSLVSSLRLKPGTNRSAADAEGCAAQIISHWAGQVRDGCGDVLWPSETAHIIGSDGLRRVGFDFIPRLAPASSRCQMGERCPSFLGK